jgi:pseudouridine-5'-phosphate glycosidase
VSSAAEVAAIAAARDELGLTGAILVTVPIPQSAEVPEDEAEAMLKDALATAEESGIRGKDITPFLLHQMAVKSNGKTLAANIALLENNARIAAQIACAL